MAVSNSFLFDESYDTAMARSVHELLLENSKANPNLHSFLEVFYNLIQTRVDAPLDIIWCYCYLNFRCSDFDQGDLLQRASGAKELFLHISKCSISCKPGKSVILLAPLVFQLTNLVEDLSSEMNWGSKLWKTACNRTMSLISQIIGYISACCSKESLEGDIALPLLVSIDDLVNLWRDDTRTASTWHSSLLGFVKKMNFGNDMVQLAGNLIAEFFLLKLCSDLRFGNKGSQTEKEIISWSASCINAFQNMFFFDSIMMKLLEFPMQTLGSEEDHVLRTILYDAVILVDYRFLTSDRGKRLAEDRSKEILLKRVLIVCEAMEFFRSRGDHKRECSCSSALSYSKFCLQMVKRCVNGVAMEEDMEKLKGLSSLSLLKWLVEFEVEGVKLFDDTELVKKAKLIVKNAGMGSEKVLSDCELFYIDNKGSEERGIVEDDKMNDSLSAAFVAAARTMKGKKWQSGKRKGEANDEEKKRQKIDREGDEDGETSSDGSLSSESELDNPSSDED